MWGTVLKRDLLGEVREEDKFHSKEELQDFLKSEIERQGKNVVIRDLDVSSIKDLGGLFKNIAIDTETLDLSGWKTSNIKDMSDMFDYCDSLESLDVSGWDTSKVEDMNWMFSYCKNLKSLDLSGWDTSNVKDMSGMFYSCECLKSLNLSGWDTSNVYDMIYMFDYCPAPYKVVGKNKIVKK